MSLYHNIIQWDWNLEDRPEIPNPEYPTVGEFVSYNRYPFGEYNLDPIFKINCMYDDFHADLEVLYSNVIPLGTKYLRQSMDGFRRVKLSSVEEVTSMAYSASSVDPQPAPIQILRYKKNL